MSQKIANTRSTKALRDYFALAESQPTPATLAGIIVHICRYVDFSNVTILNIKTKYLKMKQIALQSEFIFVTTNTIAGLKKIASTTLLWSRVAQVGWLSASAK